jgi:hypothetical protein
MSIAFSLTKIYYKEFVVSEDECTGKNAVDKDIHISFRHTRWLPEECEDQQMDTLNADNYEQIKIAINTMPFMSFYISPLGEDTPKYILTSESPISLRNYEEQFEEKRIENWGEFDEIFDCINRAINIAAGFMNGLKTGEINDGNYYEDE